MGIQNTTPTQLEEGQELVTKLSPEQRDFYQSCADKSGMTLEQWMAFEPF